LSTLFTAGALFLKFLPSKSAENKKTAPLREAAYNYGKDFADRSVLFI